MRTSYSEQLTSPKFINTKTNQPLPNANGWQDRHLAALRFPSAKERSIVTLLAGWAHYADQHRAAYESGIGHDYVLGSAWKDIGLSLLTLLSGEIGRLDCGTLDGFIRHALTSEGFDAGV